MATSVAQKLRIKEGFTLLTINAPNDFKKSLGATAPGVSITANAKNYSQVHWFVLNKAQLEKELNKILKLVKADVVLWIYYPKGTSKIQTDLTRDKGWENLLKHDELQWISLISFNDTWSTFGCRLKTAADKKKEEKPKENRPILDYIDPVKKTVRLPDDLATALNKNKKAATIYESLAYSHRKEYVEWIITAKREETRTQRIKGTLDRLLKGWKNPANN
jgi:Bacteriocin-protection, YdeI or OmpD-Associated